MVVVLAVLPWTVPGGASAASGPAPLRLSLSTAPAPTVGTGATVPGQEFALPAGVLNIVGAQEMGPTPQPTAQVRFGPCGAVPTAGPVDLVVRAHGRAAVSRLVPAGWCAVADQSIALGVVVVGTIGTDPNAPGFIDIPDVTLPRVAFGADATDIHISFDTYVPPDAVAVALVATSAGATGLRGDDVAIQPCLFPDTAAVDIGSGGLRSTLAIVPFSPSGLPSHELCIHPHAQGPGPLPVRLTILGYFGTGTPTPDWSLPEFRYQPLGAPAYVPVSPRRLFDTRDEGAAIEAGGVHRLDLTGLPDEVSALVLNVTVTGPTAPGYLTVYPCDVDIPTASSLNYTAGQIIANQVTVGLLASRTLCFYTQARTHLVVDLAGTYDLGRGDGFEPADPQRLFDTRAGGAALAAGSVYRLDASGLVPATASALTMNVTVTDTVGTGFLTVYPCEDPRPTASNLNYTARSTVPNLVTVKVGASRTVCFYVHGTTHLFADLAGWYSPTVVRGFIDNVPSRVFDTRSDLGIRIPASEYVYVTWNPGVDAVALNVTGTDSTGAGFVTVYPCAGGRPTASNLNYEPGQTVANAVVTRPGSDRQSCFYAHAATHLVADITGYFYSGLDYAYDTVLA